MATTSGTAKVTLPSDEEILVTRELDAPRRLVYRAWTTPDLVQRWWAGRRGRVTTVDIDLHVGGRWRYVMETNGGFEVAFHGTYLEIVPEERIVTTEVFEMPDQPEPPDDQVPVNVVTFTETDDGRTVLRLLSRCGSKDLRDAILESGMEGGMQEQMDLLDELASSLRG